VGRKETVRVWGSRFILVGEPAPTPLDVFDLADPLISRKKRPHYGVLYLTFLFSRPRLTAFTTEVVWLFLATIEPVCQNWWIVSTMATALERPRLLGYFQGSCARLPAQNPAWTARVHHLSTLWVDTLSQMPWNLHKHSAYRYKPPTNKPMLNASDNVHAKHHWKLQDFCVPHHILNTFSKQTFSQLWSWSLLPEPSLGQPSEHKIR
jgi:hypothetical protein